MYPSPLSSLECTTMIQVHSHVSQSTLITRVHYHDPSALSCFPQCMIRVNSIPVHSHSPLCTAITTLHSCATKCSPMIQVHCNASQCTPMILVHCLTLQCTNIMQVHSHAPCPLSLPQCPLRHPFALSCIPVHFCHGSALGYLRTLPSRESTWLHKSALL